jgi:aspartyl-tRNA(Asn)/glutamyl-tRNA(Gln) amidotransferase subunit A
MAGSLTLLSSSRITAGLRIHTINNKGDAAVDANDLIYLSLHEASNLIDARQVSPVELTEACIARAEKLDGELNGYLTQTFDTARKEVQLATEEIAAGRRIGPLHGIPFALKDLYETAVVRTTGGSRLRDEYIPTEDAETVARLKQAGAVMLGKLNLHEWAMGGTNVNVFFPTPRNPWDKTKIVGGSSGGSSLALAAGYCYGALGSDTRASIRLPAALCGVTGLKPTYGRVSLRGVIPLVWSLDHAGPMARSAEDCALILNVIAGYDERDPTSVDAPVPDYVALLQPAAGKPLEHLRIGVPRNFFFDESVVQPEVLAAVHATMPVFESLGAELADIDFPDPDYHSDNMVFNAESAAFHEERLKERPEELSDAPRQRVAAALELRAVDYVRARWRQEEFKQKVRVLIRDIDLVLTPTAAVTAFDIDSVNPLEPAGPGRILARQTAPFNTLGVPAISVPCGFSSQGLPIGLQLSGRWWEDGLVLRAAHAYQQVTDWHRLRPPV